jgi:hypothetical protein
MVVREKLQQIVNYVRTLWRPTGPDSYQRYRADHERERKEAEHARVQRERSKEREREGAERERGYEERYRAERVAEEPGPEAPRRDPSQPK